MHKGHNHRRPGRTTRSIIRSSPIVKGTVNINLLGTVDSHNAHVGRVLRLGTVEQGLVVSAVVVIVASALQALLAQTNDGNGVVMFAGIVDIVVWVCVGVCVGAI